MSRHPSRLPAVPTAFRRIGILSTYPPQLCGLATFAAALELGLVRAGERVEVVRIDDGAEGGLPQRATRAVLVNGSPSSIRQSVAALSSCDVAIVQHEYGIYGGHDGDEVIGLLAAVDAPTIVILHTVLVTPTAHQRSVLETVCGLADRVVVMTHAARTRLCDVYDVDARKVISIPHGAAAPTHVVTDDTDASGQPAPTDQLEMLTWGLLGPGKGIEHVIDALRLMKDVRPSVRYTVAGVTHPKVFARYGDEYRHSLMQRTWANGVARSVTFDDTYRDVPTLTKFVNAASVVVLPYDSRDQATSGVLVDAVAAGRPVIATAFPHAVELLSSGAGIVIPHGDVAALAEAVRSVATDRDRLEDMATEARCLAPTLWWSGVTARYRALCDELCATAALANEPVALRA